MSAARAALTVGGRTVKPGDRLEVKGAGEWLPVRYDEIAGEPLLIVNGGVAGTIRVLIDDSMVFRWPPHTPR